MGLPEEIQSMRSEIRTDEYSMSVGEWMNLYENNELDIHPEFQRFFRWTNFQKSRLIESLLLGIPIPMIFVSQRDDGVWDVVDGMQRLSTIFQFAGILKDHQGNTVAPLVLEKTEYLPSLNGVRWDDPDDSSSSLDLSQRLQLKRSKISVSIILKESDSRSKYDLFQRLNRGGTQLTDQEVRNCIMVMVDDNYYTWMRELAEYEPFIDCISITDKAKDEQYNMELALRFLVFRTMKEDQIRRIGDMSQLLQDEMVQMANSQTFDRDKESRLFKRTFDVLNESLSSRSFRRYDAHKNQFSGGFLISGFEMVAMGLGYHVDSIVSQDPDRIEKIARDLWTSNSSLGASSGGVRASTRVPRTVTLGREKFRALTHGAS